MKKILPLFLLVFSFSMAWAQSGPGSSDPEAKKILDAVTAKFKTYSTVKASFTFQVEDANGKVQGTKTGTAYLKGDQYKVELTDQEIFCDGKTVWTYDKASNEVQVSKFDASENSFTPQKAFTNFYDKDFLYKLNDEKKQGGKTLQEIELTPTDKGKAFFKILAYVDKLSKNIVSTKLFEKNGSRYVYNVTSFTPNAKIDNSAFTFDAKKYPGVEVIDLR
ncbi:MAG: outer membrane lipoprotein carrier protein LolA [Chitinophagaceae bacterium]|nr:outer membrane lipoprotein carrier protein LolA [Chitinophagaceae bacterium]MCW5926469.1 outer membrane lipoprotein carrier protein LolA [Chitinophagaceae bacterium]